ncbi:MAG TPA: hypothetical protein VMS11_15650 [Solirubrobacterales bacterium]|nr:hypothetical protein [Solirubrobacterales bacterium]
MKQLRKRLTYANVMSSLAVFLVLGGATAFAATKIGGNEIKANAISTGKIKKEAITTSKIKKSAIDTARIADGAVTGAKVNLGSLGTVPTAATANNANNLGGLAASAYQRRVQWATVKSDGTIVQQSGGITSFEHAGNGYYLNFGSSLVGRGSFVSFSYLDPDFSGFVVSQPCAGPGNNANNCAPTAAKNNPNVLFVQTHDAANNPVAEGFTVLVTP